MTERATVGAGELSQDLQAPARSGNRLLRWIRRFFWLCTFLYAGALLLFIPLAHFIGEQNLTVAVLLFVPRQVFLLPLIVLFPLTLLFTWRAALLQLVGAMCFVTFGMGWQFQGKGSGKTDGGTFTVLSYNRGQHQNQSLQPFKNLVRPDVMTFQEATARAAGYVEAAGYEEFGFGKDAGEFTLVSRYPIRSAELLTFGTEDDPAHPAARFIIESPQGPVAVYNVHFPSPRDVLHDQMRGAFLYGLLGFPGTPWVEKRRANQEPWDLRVSMARELLSVLEQEKLPFILAGDFNAPSGGYIHGLFDEQLFDAHEEAGEGFGFTFPGTTRNPLSLGGPWMRIDYVFSGPDWEVIDCVTEKERPSQHRAVAATLRLKDGTSARTSPTP